MKNYLLNLLEKCISEFFNKSQNGAPNNERKKNTNKNKNKVDLLDKHIHVFLFFLFSMFYFCKFSYLRTKPPTLQNNF